MSKKSSILTGSGIFLLILGIFFSLVEHNPGSTVPSFTYGCVFETVDFLASHRGLGTDYCHYNISLSVIISCVMGAGAFLAFSGLKNRNPDRRMLVRISAVTAVFGGLILVMIFAVLAPIAECRAGGTCLYDSEPYPVRYPPEYLEGFFRIKYDDGEITIAEMIHMLDREGYDYAETREFLTERIKLPEERVDFELDDANTG